MIKLKTPDVTICVLRNFLQVMTSMRNIRTETSANICKCAQQYAACELKSDSTAVSASALRRPAHSLLLLHPAGLFTQRQTGTLKVFHLGARRLWL